MLYGFITDTAMHQKSAVMSISAEADRGSGYLTDDMANYFGNKATIADVRSSRLTVLPQIAKGDVEVHIDKTKFASATIFDSVTTVEWQQFMNIIELVYLSPSVSAVDLNTALQADSAAYGVYVADSLSVSAITNPIPITLSDDTSQDVAMRTWIQFTVTLNAVTTSFHLWIDKEAFLQDWPDSTITAIIPPASPINLVNLPYASVISAIKETADYSGPLVDTTVKTADHTGVLQYSTRYVNSSLATHYQLTFGVFYKGAPPTSQTARIAIRTYLEATAGIDPNLWKTIFPDLYTTGQFYLIPIWDNIKVVGASTIYKGIVKGSPLAGYAKTVLAENDVFIDTNYSILRTSISELYLLAVPHGSNEADTLDLGTIHDTYQPVDAQNINYGKQSDVTKDFNEKVCGCLSNLLGSTTNANYIPNTINGRQWLSFTSNFIEYHMLYRTSFPGIS